MSELDSEEETVDDDTEKSVGSEGYESEGHESAYVIYECFRI